MSRIQRAVLMGDPGCFQIQGGANPHTRDRWGRRKTVDGVRARAQWAELRHVLQARGVVPFVLPARPESPGMVFPANAGFMTALDELRPTLDKTFLLSQALPTRVAEKEVYRRFVQGLGFRVADVSRRFEGEADLFPAGDVHLFTSGPLERQRFIPRWGWPPYRRVYGFRSDAGALDDLKGYVDTPVLPLTLTRETHYHGDTCLCAFGPKREFLMVYLPALTPESQSRLREHFRERLLILSESDGENFAANSFQLTGESPTLFMPNGVSAGLRAAVTERGVDPVTVDVSEFMSKGGGSVKCMIGDLGWVDFDAPVSAEVADFRRRHGGDA